VSDPVRPAPPAVPRAEGTMEPVAIVGIGCLFPRSPDLETYWRNILATRASTRTAAGGTATGCR
jgi:hypothetical protein